MSREWKPGDVAVVQSGTSCARIGLRNQANDGWRTAAGLMSDETCPDGAWNRPLVIVDPQDHDDLWREFQSRREQGVNPRRALREALDALANPTPPKCRSSVEFRYGDGVPTTSACTLDDEHDGMHSAGPFMWGGAA